MAKVLSAILFLITACETSMDLTPDPLIPDVTNIECEDVCAGNVPAEAYQCLADEPPSCEDWLASRCESGEIDCIPWGDRLLCGCELEVLP